MRRRWWRASLPLLLACAIGLFASWPLLTNPGLPEGTDAELHIYRTAELGYSLRAGALYPRWAPDFYHGHGYPIFNYYAPLTYYLSYALSLGRPEAAEAGVKATLVVSQVLGAAGAYMLGRVFGRRGGGVLGALAYSLAPYVQLVNPHIRGAIAESVALGFLPWALWSWEMLWRRGRGAPVPAVLTTAAVFLSHNLTGLSCLALVGLLGVWRAVGKGRALLVVAAWTVAAFALLTAFFWVPFVLERSAVQLNVAGDGHYDFRNHFVALRQLFAWVGPMDRRAASAHVPMSAGPPVLLFAFAGIALQLRRRTPLGDLLVYAVAAMGCLWLVTPASAWLWECVPGLPYYQFPWRFLGPAAVCLVPLVASLCPGARHLVHTTCPRGAVAGERASVVADLLAVSVGLLLVFAALPGLYPLPWVSTSGAITPLSIVQEELRGRWRGTTSTNDFVPVTVEMIPGPVQSVLASYRDPPIDRVNRSTLPEGTSVSVIPDKPWVNRFRVSGSKGFALRLYLFQFPGWHATVDGEAVSITMAHPEGFVTVPVPAGDHEVVVRFGSTPARSIGWALSACGILVMAVASRGGARLPELARDEARGRRAGASDTGAIVGLSTMMAVVVVTKALVLDHSAWFQPTSPEGTAAAVEFSQRSDLGGQVLLLGYDLTDRHQKSGGTVEVALYWAAQRPLTETYQSFVHLVGPEGVIRTQSDNLNPGGFPTNLWPTDRYVIDVHTLKIPSDTPPGPYLLSVGLYTLTGSNGRLPIRYAECGLRPDSVTLCRPITVLR